jgi:hypothetical protein
MRVRPTCSGWSKWRPIWRECVAIGSERNHFPLWWATCNLVQYLVVNPAAVKVFCEFVPRLHDFRNLWSLDLRLRNLHRGHAETICSCLDTSAVPNQITKLSLQVESLQEAPDMSRWVQLTTLTMQAASFNNCDYRRILKSLPPQVEALYMLEAQETEDVFHARRTVVDAAVLNELNVSALCSATLWLGELKGDTRTVNALLKRHFQLRLELRLWSSKSSGAYAFPEAVRAQEGPLNCKTRLSFEPDNAGFVARRI